MITQVTAEKIIRKAFKNASIVSINLYKKGIINRNYEIITLNPKKKLILRIFPKDGWKAEKEQYVYNLISKHIKIPVPKIFLCDTTNEIVDYSYLLLSKIKGTELDIAYKKSSNKELIISAGKYLAMIHSIKLPAFGWIMNKGISPSFEKWTEFLEYDLEEKLSKLKNSKHFPQEFIGKSRKYFTKNRKLLEITDKPSLLHKDYHFSHIIADEWQINGIIDVEWAIAGYNELDLEKSIMWMFDKVPELEEYFLEGYKKLGKLSKSFYIRKPIYDFLILISSLSLAYEYNNMGWVKEHIKKLRGILNA